MRHQERKVAPGLKNKIALMLTFTSAVDARQTETQENEICVQKTTTPDRARQANQYDLDRDIIFEHIADEKLGTIFQAHNKDSKPLEGSLAITQKLAEVIDPSYLDEFNPHERTIITKELFANLLRVYYESTFMRDRIDYLIQTGYFQIIPTSSNIFAQITGRMNIAAFSGIVTYETGIQALQVIFNMEIMSNIERDSSIFSIIKHELMHAVDMSISNLTLLDPFSDITERTRYEALYDQCVNNLSNSQTSTSDLAIHEPLGTVFSGYSKKKCNTLTYTLKQQQDLTYYDLQQRQGEVTELQEHWKEGNIRVDSNIFFAEEKECLIRWLPTDASYTIARANSIQTGYNSDGINYDADYALTERGTNIMGDIRTAKLVAECPDFIGYYEDRFKSMTKTSNNDHCR